MSERLPLISRHTLGSRVMALLGLALLFTLIVFSVSVFLFVNRTESDAWRNRQREAARLAAGTIGGFVQRIEDTLLVLGVLELGHRVTDPDGLQTLLRSDPALLEIVRLDRSGRVLAEASRDRSVLASLITIPQSRWFLQARQGHIYLSDVQLSAAIRPYLIIALPSSDEGVVAARVEMNVLWNVVQDIHFGESGRVYVVNPNGRVVAHTDPDVVVNNASIQGQPMLAAMLTAPGQTWSGTYAGLDGQVVAGYSSPIPATDWLVVTELPLTEAYAATRNAILVLGAEALALMVLVNGTVAWYLRRNVARPLARVRLGAHAIGEGDFHHRIRLDRRDEIGQLAQAFDDMADRLMERDRLVAEQTAALQRGEARYRAIVEDQTELICRYRPDGTLTFVNEAYCRYFGKTRAALLNQSFAPLIPEEDQPVMAAHLAQLGPENPVAVVEHRVILPDGQIRWQRWTDRAILDAQGQVVEFQAVGRDITERRIAEMALRASEAGLRRITDNMFDVISQVDAAGVIQYASPSHEWVLGVAPESVIGQSIFERLHPDDLTPAVLAFAEALQRGSARQAVSFRYQHAAGHYVWMEAVGSFLHDPHGEVTGIILSSRDISARKQMEAALRESERLYRLLAENATDLIWVRDLSLRLTYISPSVFKLCGFTVEEALTQTVSDILTPESAEAALLFYADILAAAHSAPADSLRTESRRLESELMCKDGSTLWTESVMTFLTDEQGHPTGILGVTRDISDRRRAAEQLRRANLELEDRVRARTAELERLNVSLTAEVAERQRAEAALRESEARLRRITDNMLDMIVQTDALGRYEYVSPSHQPNLGYAPQALLGRSIFDNLHPDDAEQALQVAMAAIAAAAPTRLELRYRHADGRYVWIESVGNPLLDEQGRVVGSIIGSRDITERRQAEEHLRASLHEKEVLLKEIHHRVKNNLQIISSLLNLQASSAQDPQTLELLHDSQNRVRSMALVHEKLYRSPDLARISFGDYAQSLTAQLLRTYSTVAGSVALRLDVEDIWLDVEAAVPCGLIINELVSNALKHAFPGGRVGEIGLDIRQRPAGRIQLQIHDTGIGFPAHLDFRTSPSLGLQLVNTLVEQLGGTIERLDGAGTSFQIEFPATGHTARGEPA